MYIYIDCLQWSSAPIIFFKRKKQHRRCLTVSAASRHIRAVSPIISEHFRAEDISQLSQENKGFVRKNYIKNTLYRIDTCKPLKEGRFSWLFVLHVFFVWLHWALRETRETLNLPAAESDRAVGYRKMAGGKFDDLHFVKTNNSMLQTCNKNSHTVDGSEILANHLRCIKPCKRWDEVPTSTGAGFLSSTVTLTLFFLNSFY